MPGSHIDGSSTAAPAVPDHPVEQTAGRIVGSARRMAPTLTALAAAPGRAAD